MVGAAHARHVVQELVPDAAVHQVTQLLVGQKDRLQRAGVECEGGEVHGVVPRRHDGLHAELDDAAVVQRESSSRVGTR